MHLEVFAEQRADIQARAEPCGQMVHSAQLSLDEEQLGRWKPPIGPIIQQLKTLIPNRMHQTVGAKIERPPMNHRFDDHIEQPGN